ncbi:MAG: Gfo/Idh/MocA family oxidoreductase [Verrucomicrobiota bacterium]|jgi:predicted dehydrogenase
MKMKFHTRREFIKTTALAAASVSFAGALASRARAAEPDRKIGFALAGLGRLSTYQLAPALQKTKYCRLAGIVTGHPAKAEQWKTQYNIPDKNIYNYDNMEKMADNPDIDVVYVVTPNALHAELSIKAAKAGKHVLCEKPMEVSVEKCQQIIDACKQAGRQLAIGYRLHFEPNNLECVRLAREKVFGDLKIIEAGFGFPIGDPTQWRLKRDLAGGGPLMDVGIYALQATRYLTGEEPVLVSAIETVTDPVKFKEVEESIVWQTKFPSGAIAHCCATYRAPGLAHFTAYAQKGWFKLDPAFLYSGIQGQRSDKQEIHLPAIDQFAAEMDDFAQCILNNQPTKVPGEEGLRDVKIMMAIYEAARTGKTVSLA